MDTNKISGKKKMYPSATQTTADTGWFSPSLASPELIWRLSPKWRLEFVNRPYHGMQPEDLKREGYPLLRKLLAGRDPALLDDAVLKAIKRGAPVPVLETSGENPVSGELVHFMTSLTPVIGNGRLIGVQGVTRDVSLLRVVELARERRLSELAAISYMTSHIGTARTMKELVRQVLQGALDVIGGYVGCIVLHNDQRRYRWCTPSIPVVKELHRWASEQGDTFDPNEVLRVTPVPETLATALNANDVHSVGMLPIRQEGHTIGMVTLTSSLPADKLATHAKEMMFAVHHLQLSLVGMGHGTLQQRRQYLRDSNRQRAHVLSSFTRAFSHGKLLILTQRELASARHLVTTSARVSNGPVVITNSLVLPRVRRVVEDMAARGGCDEDQAADLALCATEAATNVLVHGGKGEVSAHLFNDRIQVWIQDQGGGIDLVALTRSALLRTYSSKASMGLGFNLMLELADQVSVYTSSKGTTLILECRIRQHPAQPDYRGTPAWDRQTA